MNPENVQHIPQPDEDPHQNSVYTRYGVAFTLALGANVAVELGHPRVGGYLLAAGLGALCTRFLSRD